MKDASKLLVIFIAALVTMKAWPTPSGTHLRSLNETMERLDTVSNWDAGRKLHSPLANLLTEPLIRGLWLTQIVSDSDWIGIKALASASYRIDPGGADDASNIFIYTCKAGWVDVGHMIYTALAAKVIYQGLKGNPLINFGLEGILIKESPEAKFLKKVQPRLRKLLAEIKKDQNKVFGSPSSRALLEDAVKLRMQNYLLYTKQKVPTGNELSKRVAKELNYIVEYLNKHAKKLGEVDHIFWGFWTGFFSMQAGYRIEVLQNEIKEKKKPSEWDGNATSAWTLEDLPSDAYGVLMGLALERKVTQRGVIRDMKEWLYNFLDRNGAVDPATKSQEKGCLATAGDVLKSDTAFYQKIAENTYVTHKPSDSSDPLSPYNYTVNYKRTRNHTCVCDAKDEPVAHQSSKEGTNRSLAGDDKLQSRQWYEFFE